MKTNIHPKWNNQTQVTCSCGNTFTTGSILDNIRVELCSQCHPFYTGEMKFVDVQGRVEKFQAKQQQGKAYQQTKKVKMAKKIARDQAPQKSLKDMLQELKQTQDQSTPETNTPDKKAKN